MKISWLPSLLASANESLNDRRTMGRYTAGLLIIGAAIRLAWVFHNGFGIIPSEGFYEAAAFGSKGELADAYGPGSGLTAHLSPGMPLLVGTIYRFLGVATPTAEFALSCVSLAFIYISFLALDAAFRRLGVEPIARIAAIAVLALAPLNIFFEMKGFRHWEGSFAAAGIGLCLARALALDALDGRPYWRELVLLAGGRRPTEFVQSAGRAGLVRDARLARLTKARLDGFRGDGGGFGGAAGRDFLSLGAPQ